MGEYDIFQQARERLGQLVAFTDAEWHAFRMRAHIRQLARREHFLWQGSVCQQCAYLAEGLVRHYYLVEGKEVTSDFNWEGLTTGAYQSFVSQTPARFNIVAMEDTTLLSFSRATMLALYEEYPAWQKLGRLLIEQLFNRKTLREESFLLDTPEERYRQLLLRQPAIVQRVPLVHIASYLGVTPETLSRIRSKR